MAKWEVQAWVIAPGEFPEPALKTITVKAPNITKAITTAHRSPEFDIDPVIVYISRIDPPALQFSPSLAE